jgi:TRAP-type C4-dicarboxylate transport system substrate-binding protein
VDGADGPATLFQPARMEEVVKYMSTTQHMYTPGVILASKTTIDKLPEDMQTIVFEVGAEAVSRMKELTRRGAAEAVESMEKNGLEVNEVSNDVRAEMAELCVDVYKSNRSVIGDEFFDKCMEFLGRDPANYK